MRYESSYEDWEAHVSYRHSCRNCGRLSLHLEDGWCPSCSGEAADRDAEVREDNRRAWAKFYKKHPELAR